VDSKTIIGDLEYNGKKYPFALINRCVYIIDSNGNYLNDFGDAKKEEYITGWDNNGNLIVFLKCSFENGIFNANIRFHIMGYITLAGSHDYKFDVLKFRSKAINVFYPAILSVKPILPEELKDPEKTWSGVLGATTKPSAETKVDIECENHTISFDVHKKLNYQRNAVLEVIPEMLVKVKEPQGLESILDWWLRIYDFLCFIGFRRDICFDDIELYRTIDGITSIGKVVVFNSSDSNTYDSKEFNSIIFNDIPRKNYPALIEYLSKWRSHSTYNQFLYPETRTDGKKMDNAKWLTTALSFEAIFEKKYPTFKSDENSDFAKVKQDILQYVEQQISTSSKSQRKYYERIMKALEHEGILEEKFNYYLKENGNELNDIKGRLFAIAMAFSFSPL